MADNHPAQGHYDVIVVGAGIVGASLALALSNLGLSIAVVEAQPVSTAALDEATARSAVNHFDLRVSALTLASQTLLDDLGAWPLLPANGLQPYQQMRVWDDEGTAEVHFDAATVQRSHLGHIVENRLLTAALAQRLRQAADIDVLDGRKVVSLSPLHRDRRSIVLDNGDPLQAPLLVAADGALSRIRQMATLQTREWSYGHKAIVTTVASRQPHQHTAWQAFTDVGPLAFLPLASAADGHFCSIVWSAETDFAEQLLTESDELFLSRLQAIMGARLGELTALGKRVAFPLLQRHATSYVSSRLALVGDAAHTIHPLAGQGVNLGLQDAAVLADTVRTSLQRGLDVGHSDVLQRYQRRRKGHNLLMMGAMEGFKQLFDPQPLPLRWLRNQGMRWFDNIPLLKQRVMADAMGLTLSTPRFAAPAAVTEGDDEREVV